jgi:seryl-tRNA synthetase
MLDIKLIRDNPDIIRNNIRLRFQEEEKLPIMDEVVDADSRWRESLDRLNNLRHQRNVLSDTIKTMRTAGQDAREQIESSGQLGKEIRQLEEDVKASKEALDRGMLRLPNIAHESVPQGTGEEDNVEIRTWGGKPKFGFPVKDHIDIGRELDLFDLEKAASVSGARWYYLKNQAVLLQMALMRFAMGKLVDHGFTPVYPPAMIRERVMEGAGFLPDGREDIYKIEGEDLFAVGTSEQALAGLHDGEIVEVGQLPLRYGGVSPCFRTEVGSHGRDTKGIFRVHQFEKVEMFAFTLPENSWQEHEEMLVIAEDILKDLRVPYRVVNVCTGELSSVVAKRYDIEAWLPGQEKYREVVSCSNCTDYQARRLGIRYRKAPGEPTSFVHTLNSTALASSRTLIAVLENYQTADGRVVVPDVLRPLIAKMEIIEKG